MNGIFGRLPPCTMNGYNYGPPPGMDFYDPAEASLYGKQKTQMFACLDVISSAWITLIFPI